MSAERAAPVDDDQLRELIWAELREVAKSGLADPGLLIEREYLLNLSAVRRRATTPDALGRARALVDVLLDVIHDLGADASPRRRELLTCLFKRDEDAPKQLTRRRETLAGVGYEEDTSGFRRREEIPLYKEIAQLLLERADDTTTEPPPSRFERDRLVMLALQFSGCSHQIAEDLAEAAKKPGRADLGKKSFRSYCALQVGWDDLSSSGGWGHLSLINLFPSAVAFLEFRYYLLPHAGLKPGTDDTWEENPYPFDKNELARLRHHFRLYENETVLFWDYFQATENGTALLNAWVAWLDQCSCTTNVSKECAVHNFLELCAKFVEVANKAGLGIDALQDK